MGNNNGEDDRDYEPEKILANVNILLLTLLLLISQVHPNVEERLAVSLVYLGYIGFPFAFSLFLSVSLLFIDLTDSLFRYARIAEYMFFVLGIIILMSFIGQGLDAMNISTEVWIYMTMLVFLTIVFIAVIEKLGGKITKYVKKK